VSDAEILYSFRVPFQNVLMRGRAQVVKLEASRNGELVAPTVLGSSFSLFDPQGTAIIDAQPITLVDLVATYSITALELPDTIEYSELYQERWGIPTWSPSWATTSTRCNPSWTKRGAACWNGFFNMAAGLR